MDPRRHRGQGVIAMLRAKYGYRSAYFSIRPQSFKGDAEAPMPSPMPAAPAAMVESSGEE